MGAKARAWVNRGALALVVVIGVVGVALSPIPVAAKVLVLLTAAGAGGYFAFRLVPAFDPLGRIRWRLPMRRDKVCAITFDDGPSADTSAVLEILDRCDVRATFFLLAANARRHQDVLNRLVAAGHTIAVHGTTHQKLHDASDADIERELSTAIAELTRMGAPVARLYRTPHGLKNAAVFRVARKLNCQLWAWSRGIWDTDGPAADVLVARAMRFAQSGMVLLLHDGRGDEPEPNIKPMLQALPEILGRLRANGFRFVTLDQRT
jgi:peptidoglycan/xylan/chitin deacetylase (PgdA/CDA1 family)